MNQKEYKECLEYELYRGSHLTFLHKIRIKYFQPNTNCVYMARRMWYLYGKGGLSRLMSRFIYLRIIHKYGCIIFPKANIGKGFTITHPVGIVIGACSAGENFTIYQNCSVGVRGAGKAPVLGNNVDLCTGSCILGEIHIADDVRIGAMSLVIHDITEPGVYAGIPLRKIH